jgi:hypothetical protein
VIWSNIINNLKELAEQLCRNSSALKKEAAGPFKTFVPVTSHTEIFFKWSIYDRTRVTSCFRKKNTHNYESFYNIDERETDLMLVVYFSPKW